MTGDPDGGVGGLVDRPAAGGCGPGCSPLAPKPGLVPLVHTMASWLTIVGMLAYSGIRHIIGKMDYYSKLDIEVR